MDILIGQVAETASAPLKSSVVATSRRGCARGIDDAWGVSGHRRAFGVKHLPVAPKRQMHLRPSPSPWIRAVFERRACSSFWFGSVLVGLGSD